MRVGRRRKEKRGRGKRVAREISGVERKDEGVSAAEGEIAVD